MARLNRWVAGTAVGVLAAFGQVSAAAAADGEILKDRAPGAIPNSYIVVLADEDGSRAQTRATINELSDEYDASVEQRYEHSVQGFAATMSREEALELSQDPAVEFVQQNQVVEAFATQASAPWGLDRIDQSDRPFNTTFNYLQTASNVTAYIIDTGIRTTHSQFGGRATWGINTVDDGINTDCHGHGTHVAATVGGSTYGVAKEVRLKAVKVLDCDGSGTTASVVEGLDWVTANHAAGQPAVANMSLGGIANPAIDSAVRRSIEDGIVYVVAAGNARGDACGYSPAGVTEAITVAASTNGDERAAFSNYGTCVDIFAPGRDITSAWNSGDNATSTISGTSMAAPHVAGAAALLLGANPTLTPAQVANTLLLDATRDRITNAGTGTPNRLLYLGTTSGRPANCRATNGTDVAIPDFTAVVSPVTISNCAGKASATATVEVHIKHTFRGDLVVYLFAPDGQTYWTLWNRKGNKADDLDEIFTVNLSSLNANGTWKLRVLDSASGDTGYIDSWTLRL